MEPLDKLLHLLELNRKMDPFYLERDSMSLFLCLDDEIVEARQEYEAHDDSSLENEIGDIFWDLYCLMNKLEDEGKISKSTVFENIHTKMCHRKTFLLEGRSVTKQEAVEIWNEAKRKEGYSDDHLWVDGRYPN